MNEFTDRRLNTIKKVHYFIIAMVHTYFTKIIKKYREKHIYIAKTAIFFYRDFANCRLEAGLISGKYGICKLSKR